MSASLKSNGLLPPSSFTPISNAAINIKNSAVNAMNSANTAVKNMVTDMVEPINDSIKMSYSNGQEPFFTLPVIFFLGLLVIVLIMVIIFRDQVSMSLEYAWRKLKGWISPEPPAPPPPEPSFVPEAPLLDLRAVEKVLPGKKVVFNIAQDKYKYHDAEPVCKAFGAELATYDQVKESWNKGADWCNYGWIKGQAAVYPTQQETYDKLQQGPEDQRMSCGVPGVNGGYFDNPELRFGVNCYGTKPAENQNDNRYGMANNHGLTPDAIEYDRKVLDYKNRLDEIPVNPFKKGQW